MSQSARRFSSATLAIFLLVFLVLKVRLASIMNLFGDEAFYWLESMHPAVAYSDLPPLTASLIGLGSSLFGNTYIGVRSVFLLLGMGQPLAIYFLARHFVGRGESRAAAMLSLCLPLVAIQGLLSLPDVPLNLLSVLLLIAALKAIRGDGTAWWMAVGICAALGLATHFRMLVPLAALAGFLLFSGRQQLRGPGPWLAAGIAMLGLLPTLLFNLRNDFASFRFQFSDRHPWSFQADGLWQPLQQALVTTPLLYALLIAAAFFLYRRARNSGGSWTLLAWASLFPPLFYFFAGLFTDQVRVSFHWPLVAYLPLCVLLPQALDRLLLGLRSRLPNRLAWCATATVPGVGIIAGFGLIFYLFYAISSENFRAPNSRAYPDNLLGWSEAAAAAREMMVAAQGPAYLMADNFMLAAELSFELDGLPVFSLAHPLNTKHGRARQIAIWDLDESAWLRDVANDTLLVMEVSAVKAEDLPAWLHRSCELIGGWHLERQMQLHAGRKHFIFFRQDRELAGYCDYPAIAYLDEPAATAVLSGDFSVSGWAFEDNEGVAAVEVQVDGTAVGEARYGLSRPGVQGFFPQSTDPGHPAVGFELTLDSTDYTNGWHDLRVVVLAVDGGQHPGPSISIQFKND